MTESPEPLDPSVERLARLKGDRCKARIAADRLKSLTDQIDEGEIAAEAEVFRAICDPFRLSIPQRSSGTGELCVCEIMTALDRPQSSTSHHLSIR